MEGSEGQWKGSERGSRRSSDLHEERDHSELRVGRQLELREVEVAEAAEKKTRSRL